MRVSFREFDPFNVWFWIEFPLMPSEQEKQYVEEVFDSWFFLGKLGGFDAENLQIQDTGLEIGYMDYDPDRKDASLVSLMHNMGEFEYEGNWARCWLDLGTSDAIALDVLVNTLMRLSQEFVPLEQLIIGGENEDWRVPEHEKPEFVQDEWN
ncbi:DUF3531 family protein [filamentous cyanobacterium LEGE 11480]|uniref:DUF3531 family protein n=1 Tax=Romeriopsis navalis LEGE 11480 TaxID=2777977 RepID=A0A928VQI4_9CYAN|nr:DUF3531 family protein [Romeriopsis navalis]MBE9030269.1 DUF3531 family protein [Romeriopsis navalis LEGE 11480]